MVRPVLFLALGLLAMSTTLNGHTVGVQTTQATGPLKPGEYYWQPELSPDGPVVVFVSLPQQVMVVYRNGVQIGRSTVSTGAKGHQTPTGVFEILQKKEEHYSNVYNNAPMPYMQRLTWSGIALHAGQLPGYPASHGCIRLPYAFSQKLYTVTQKGGTVIIADEKSPGAAFAASPGIALAPKDASPGTLPPLENGQYQWMPERSAKGPVTILISGADRKMYVYRNGILIGRAAVEIKNPKRLLGGQVFTLLEGTLNRTSPFAPGRRARPWMEVDSDEAGKTVTGDQLAKRIRISPDFARKVYDLITPGTNVVVTDEPALRDADSNFTIISND